MKSPKFIKNFALPVISPQIKYAFAAICCFVAILLVIIFFVFPKSDVKFREGDVAKRDYSAPFDIEFENTQLTAEKQQNVLSSIQPVYLVDQAKNQVLFTRMNDFLDLMKTFRSTNSLPNTEKFTTLTGKEYWSMLEKSGFSTADLNTILGFSEPDFQAFRKGLIEVQAEILAQNIQSSQINTAYNRIKTRLRTKIPQPIQQMTGEKILQAFISENVILDVERTNLNKDNLLKNFKPVTEKIIKGEIYLREGDKINNKHLDILNTIYKPEPKKEARIRLKKIITLSLIMLFAFVIFWYFMNRLPRNPLVDDRYYHIFLVQTFLTVCGGVMLSRLIPVDELSLYLMIPLVVNAWIVTYFISRQASLLSTLFQGTFLALAFGLDRSFLLTSMITGAISSYLIKRDCHHGEIFNGLIFIVLIGTLTNLSVTLLFDQPLNNVLTSTRIIWISSISSVPIMIALSWLYVFQFKVVTWYHLNELSDVNNSLIRQLRHNSPGSYHHSLMVGDIGEIAADTIGANGLLVRVASLYHDIGKAKMPQFYIENQIKGANPHDRYPPSLSRLIVLSHVKDGVVMARKAGLPREIIDGIQQHQGTTLMKYFYRKALAQSDGQPVDEYDYRYEGPIPQYPEMAIIALADSAESAVRSLDEPSPHRIEATVNAIFQERLLDGQFDDSQLTISQLNALKNSLVNTLSGIYHSRIEYPDVKELKDQFEKQKNGNKTN